MFFIITIITIYVYNDIFYIYTIATIAIYIWQKYGNSLVHPVAPWDPPPETLPPPAGQRPALLARS